MKSRLIFVFSVVMAVLFLQNCSLNGDERNDGEAMFPGGNEKISLWIAQHVNYPKSCIRRGIEGRVLVEFVVKENGAVSNIHLVKKAHVLLNKEAVRLLRTMPDWIPAKHSGKAIPSRCRLPINFTLD